MLLLALGLPLVMTFAWYQGERASRRFRAGECTIISLLLLSRVAVLRLRRDPESPLRQAGLRRRPSPPRAPPPLPQRRDLARGAAVRESVVGQGAGIFLRRHDRRDHRGARQGAGSCGWSRARRPSSSRARTATLRASAKRLHATHLIEGSVRKAGNRVRITAQLIKADDGTHIWAEDYDRELTDIFAIQEDIARAITASLRMPLGLKPGENLVNNRNIDPDLYDQLLRARGLIVSRTAVGDQSRPELTGIGSVAADCSETKSELCAGMGVVGSRRLSCSNDGDAD